MATSEPYQRRPKEQCHYDPRLITKLVDNYRSHPAILELPNRLFYDGELKVCADKLIRECLCKWDELPKKDFPIIFHGVVGQEAREGRSPSFFNPEEISVVHDYVVKLLTDRKIMKLKETDIGIIAPYRQQVCMKDQSLMYLYFKFIYVKRRQQFKPKYFHGGTLGDGDAYSEEVFSHSLWRYLSGLKSGLILHQVYTCCD